MIEIVPSILSADLTRLGEQVRGALAAGTRRIHIDIMDGQFVPNISFGPLVVTALRPIADEFSAAIEAHLMVVQPERLLADFQWAGADILTVHAEACRHLHGTIQQIHGLGAQACVALNPATPLVAIEEILADLDQVLVMTVDPGLGGQDLIPSTLDKLGRLHRLLRARGLGHVMLAVDGGVHVGTIAAVAQAGATFAVAGSAVFQPDDTIHANIRALQQAGVRGFERNTPI